MLKDLLGAIPVILGGSSQPASLTGPLTELANITTELGEEADSADPNSLTTTSAYCNGAVLTNCDVFCVATTTAGNTVPRSSCYSSTCSVETECGGSAVTFTSYDHLYCPLSYGEETMSLYSYPGFTLDPVITDSGDDTSSTSTPANTDITTTPIPTTEAPTPSQSTTTPTPSTTTTSTTSTNAALAPTLTRCSTYKHCPACPQGEWRMGCWCQGRIIAPASRTGRRLERRVGAHEL